MKTTIKADPKLNQYLSKLENSGMNPKDIRRFINLLNKINEAGYTTHINSTKRSKKQNEDVGGAEDSRHLTGQAIDFNIKKGSKTWMKGDKDGWLSTGIPQMAEAMGFDWGGRYKWGGNYDTVHFDTRNFRESDDLTTTNRTPVSYTNGGENSSIYSSGTGEPSTLRYFHFDPDFIDRGIKVYKNYYNKEDLISIKDDRGTGDLGFIPLTLNIKFDGVSGWVIYDKLKINQEILPPQYPKNLDFVIMGVSHSITEGDWVTNIETISVPNFQPKIWNKNVNTYHLSSTYTSYYSPSTYTGSRLSSDLTQEEIRQIFANVEQYGNTSFSFRHQPGTNNSATGPYGWFANGGGHLQEIFNQNMDGVKTKYKDWSSFISAALSDGPESFEIEKTYQNFLQKHGGNKIERQLAFNLGGSKGRDAYDAKNMWYKPTPNNMSIGEYINKALN